MKKHAYRKALHGLQIGLAALQRQIIAEERRLLVIFEGRDSSGKDGVIKRVVEHQSPRDTRVVALGKPTDRDRSSWYFQRWTPHLPAGGEIVLFNRSWYNRAGVERVMGYSTDEEYERFLRQVPILERMLVDDGIVLLKYWFSVSDQVQQDRFASRIEDPLRRWKLSPTDLESIVRWEDYSRAKDHMFAATDTVEAPWWTVESDDKRASRLNTISHLLSRVAYEHGEPEDVAIPERPEASDYDRPPRDLHQHVPDIAAELSVKGAAS